MEAISVYFILLLLYLLYLRLGTQKQLVKFERPIQSLHELLEKSYPIQCSPSVYEYLDVLDENADSRDTMIGVVTRLHYDFHIGDSQRSSHSCWRCKDISAPTGNKERIWGTALMVNTLSR